jgi:hypothetical protein
MTTDDERVRRARELASTARAAWKNSAATPV